MNSANKIVKVGTSKSKKDYKITKNSEVYVTSDSVEVKEKNDYSSSKITTLIRNTTLKVLDIQDGWCKVFTGGRYGWIKQENLASTNYNSNNNSKQLNITYNFDFTVLLVSSIILALFPFIPPKNEMSRMNGIVYLLIYAGYMAILFIK